MNKQASKLSMLLGMGATPTPTKKTTAKKKKVTNKKKVTKKAATKNTKPWSSQGC